MSTRTGRLIGAASASQRATARANALNHYSDKGLAFGLAFGTVLTLFVVPVLYAIFFKIGPDETAAEPQGAS